MSQATIAAQNTQATTEAPVLDIFEQQAMLLAQREAEEAETIVAEDEKDDAAIAKEKEAKKAAVRRAKFNEMIKETKITHVHAHTSTYESRHGTPIEFDVAEQDAMLFIMQDQPNEPQLTATATESRGGSARMSDELE